MKGQGRVLVIAGSDSSGGAGLEADQKTIAAHGCYAMTATTALTAQDTTAVYDVHHIPPHFVAKQIKLCIKDIGVDVIKTGMLASAKTIEAVADTLAAYDIKMMVIDPVMVSTSGARLLPNEDVRALRDKLLPRATVLTPNIPEAKLLLRLDEISESEGQIKSVEDLEEMAKRVRALGPEWVLLKGGHLPFTEDFRVATPGSEDSNRCALVIDILCGPDQLLRIQSPFQDSRNTHGTGCTLASAIASNLSKGIDVANAVRSACRYIQPAIKTAPGYGKGHGPLNHFHSINSLPFSQGYFIEYLLARPDVAPVWDGFVYHPFVMSLGNGTLPLESFKGYIVQDYLYLIHFARAHALAAYKVASISDISRSSEIVAHIFREIQLHIEYCKSFGISIDEIEETPEHQACTAYTRYILDIGNSQDWLALQIALAPCLLGYGAVAKMLHGHRDTRRKDDGNTYWTWIENYVAEDYTIAVRLGSELLEKHIAGQTPQRVEELVKIFIHATKLEIGFWEMFPSR